MQYITIYKYHYYYYYIFDKFANSVNNKQTRRHNRHALISTTYRTDITVSIVLCLHVYHLIPFHNSSDGMRQCRVRDSLVYTHSSITVAALHHVHYLGVS